MINIAVLRLFLIIFAVPFLMFCRVGNAKDLSCQRVPDGKASPLKLFISLPVRSYLVNDSIVLQVTLRNESHTDLYVMKRGGLLGSLNVVFRDRLTQRDVETSFVPNLLPPPPVSPQDFQKIPCGGQVKESITLSLSDFELVAGKQYDVIAEYRSSVPKWMSFGLNIFSSDMPPVVAIPIAVEISKE